MDSKASRSTPRTLDTGYFPTYNGRRSNGIVILNWSAIMAGTQLTSKCQVTIPKEVRKALHIGKGDKVYFVADGDRAIMVPLNRDIWSVKGALKKYAKGKKFDWDEIRDEVRKARGQRDAIIRDQKV
jgi:AbrB family looped-hinge helix DNA binding protein